MRQFRIQPTVLKAAFTQQTLLHPAVAAQMREAQKAAEKLARPSGKAM